MKNPSETLRTKLNDLLEGNVTYNSKTVKVFTRPPKASEIPIVKGSLYHYIEIGDISDSEARNNADVFTHDTTVDVLVVVGWPGVGSKVVLDSIVNQVTQLIQPAKGGRLDLGSDYFNNLIEKEIDFYTEEQDTHKKGIQTIRYRLEIDET